MEPVIVVTDSLVETLHAAIDTVLVMMPIAVAAGPLISALVVSLLMSMILKR